MELAKGFARSCCVTIFIPELLGNGDGGSQFLFINAEGI